MKKPLAYVLLSLLVVYSVFADNTFSATAGKTYDEAKATPAEFILKAYKQGASSSGEDEEKYSISITNYIETKEVILDKEKYEYIITEEQLKGETRLFDIVYRTNSFDKHIDFKIEISAFEFGESKIQISPEIEIKYMFDNPQEVHKKDVTYYSNGAYKPDYIEKAEAYDVEREGYYTNDNFTPAINEYYNKYDGSFRNEFGFDDNRSKILKGTTSFSFSFYSGFNGPVHIVSKNPWWNKDHDNERYVHKADAVFTATAYVSADMPDAPFIEGSYRMHVTITAVESGL